MANKGLNHRGPQQTRVLDRDVVLLRKIDVGILGRPLWGVIANTRLGGDQLEGDQSWFLDFYVAADQPRSVELTRAIMEATTGYAIARADNGVILAEFDANEGRKAARIADGARVELAVNVAMREEEEDGTDGLGADSN